MKQRRDEAYVLRTQELGETDLIVSLFARDHGKLRGVARSARRSRRRFGGLLEPMTQVEVAWTEKTGRELHRIESMDCVRSFAAMQSDPAVQAACAVLSEVCEAFAHEEQADPRGFRLVGAVLAALEARCDPWLAVRYFEYWMLRIHGLLPDLTACSTCGRGLPQGRALRVDVHGNIRCSRCAGATLERGRTLSPRDREFLERAHHQPPSSLDADARTVRPGGALEALLRGKLESFAERRFRAYRHLDAATARSAGTPRR